MTVKRCALRRGAHLVRNGERLIGAVEELDGHEDHLLVAEIFEVVDLVLAGAIGLVAGLAGLVAVFDGGAVMDVLAAAAARSPRSRNNRAHGGGSRSARRARAG